MLRADMPATAAPLVLAFPTALPAIRLATKDDAAAAVSSWIQVAVAGDYDDSRYGKFSITPEMLAAMVLNFTSGKFPVPPTEICVDYDHLTTKASQVPGDGKAAGWFKALETRDDGTTLWARVEWTDAGAEAISSKEYRFFSPYFTTHYENQQGEDIGPALINGAITNRPFLQGMQPLSLALSQGDASRWATARAGRGVFVALTTLTDNDKRARLEYAIQQRFGTYHDDYYGWDAWFIDTIDGREAVFCRQRHYGSHAGYFIVGYTFADDGSVTFTSDPEEVVNNWARLGAGDGGRELMAKIFELMSADGKAIKISADQLEGTELVKALRAQIPAADAKVLSKAEFEAMDTTVKTLSASVETLKTESAANKAEAEKATKALAQADAEKKVDVLIAAGKVLPAQRAIYIELALNSGEMFEKLTKDAPVVIKLDAAIGGSGADASTKAQQLATAAGALRTADPKLTAEQATALALEQHPEFYEG